MLDLETLDSKPTSAIVAIGVVRFYPDHGTLGEEFYAIVDGESCQKYSMTISADTVAWWAQQSEEARSILYDVRRVPIENALLALTTFFEVAELREEGETVLWGNGSTFDNVILRNAYESAHLEVPWEYRHDFCFRTMKKMFHVDISNVHISGIRHNALDDARNQARWLMEILKKLN